MRKKSNMSEKITRAQFFRNIAGSIAEIAGNEVRQALDGVIPKVCRPPWALRDPLFTATCENCRSCGEICPRGIVFFLSGKSLSAGTPYLDFSEDYCDFCGECVHACPSGALSFDSGSKNIGLASVSAPLCVRSDGKDCTLCIEACSYEAILPGDDNLPYVKWELCNGCGACVSPCPTAAIRVDCQTR